MGDADGGPPMPPMLLLPEDPPPPKPPKEKKKKLTKAEKKELKAQKLLALQTQCLRDHLKREFEYTKKSLKRGGEEWDNMVKKIRTRELLFELEDWRKRAWRLLERKDYHIQLLIQNMDIAEEQHDRMFSMHSNLIDYLIDICKHMIDTIKAVYETEADEMISCFFEEKRYRNMATQHFQNYYENLMHGDNLINEYRMAEDEENHIFKKENIINDAIVHCYALRDLAIVKMNNLCKQLEKFFKDLEEDTINARPKEEILLAMAKQKQNDIELERTKEIAKESLETILQLQHKLTEITLESQENESKIMEERQIKHLNFLHLRVKVKRYSEITDNQIQFLATESYNVIEELKKYVEYGKHLIGVSFSCRKYQTEQEKVVPWPESNVDITLELAKEPQLQHDDSTTVRIINFKESEMLLDQIKWIENFLYRTACCEHQCRMLKKEKKKLERENQQYIDLIRTCYEAMAYQKIMKEVKASELLSTINIQPRGFD